ncbi:hypothetical protein NPIL_602461 [Nephila pilipes]|uniref:Uncharacterized protein n=1 Tax=Nephila pilipes TaxID=299642 RepID=A0A8X6MTQ6_NEPPI|nr:hypothetical protein NPIL_602461 [Nephila pilipes]
MFHCTWNVLKLSSVSASRRDMITYKHTSTVSVWLLMRYVRYVGLPVWTEITCRAAPNSTIYLRTFLTHYWDAQRRFTELPKDGRRINE